MEQFKRAQAILLETKNKSQIWSNKGRRLYFNQNNPNDINDEIRYNIPIISDDEIKEGDWCLTGLKIIRKCKSILYSNNNFKSINGYEFEDGTKDTSSACKKIIATTDTSLTINSYYEIEGNQQIQLPQPSQQFIEKYIESYNKGELITDVLVEYELGLNNIAGDYNNIQILKVNPKDNTITIKKLKESWSREEVIELLTKVIVKSKNGDDIPRINKWIEENL